MSLKSYKEYAKFRDMKNNYEMKLRMNRLDTYKTRLALGLDLSESEKKTLLKILDEIR